VFLLIVLDEVENVLCGNVDVVAAEVLALPQRGEGALANTQTDDGQREESTDSDECGSDGRHAQASYTSNSAIFAVRLRQMETGQGCERRQFGQFGHLELSLGILDGVVVVVVTLMTGRRVCGSWSWSVRLRLFVGSWGTVSRC